MALYILYYNVSLDTFCYVILTYSLHVLLYMTDRNLKCNLSAPFIQCKQTNCFFFTLDNEKVEAEIKSDVSTEIKDIVGEMDDLLNQDLGNGMTVGTFLSKSVEVKWNGNVLKYRFLKKIFRK